MNVVGGSGLQSPEPGAHWKAAEMSVPDIPVIEMVRPVLGFPASRRFALVRLDEDGGLCTLTSLDEPGVEFVVALAAVFFPDLDTKVDDETAEALGIDAAEDGLVLVVLNVGTDLASTTANLLAPLVLGVTSRRAAQVVQDITTLSVAAPLAS